MSVRLHLVSSHFDVCILLIKLCITTCHSSTRWSLIHSFFTLCLSHLESFYMHLTHFSISVLQFDWLIMFLLRLNLILPLLWCFPFLLSKSELLLKKKRFQNFEWYICVPSPEQNRGGWKVLKIKGRSKRYKFLVIKKVSYEISKSVECTL